MKKIVALFCAGGVVACLFFAASKPTAAPANVFPQDSLGWKAFDMGALEKQLSESGRPYLPFLRVPTLSSGLYKLPKGGEDKQQPHTQDEVYYVIAGKAVLSVGEEETLVKPGSVIFVRAGVEHRFHSIEEDLQVLVFFSAAESEE